MTTTKTNQLRTISKFKNLKYWQTDDIPNCYMIRSSILKSKKVTLKEEYEIMYEESDLAYSIKSLGLKVVVVKNAKIFHDIEKYKSGKLSENYMDHFMTNTKRPYLTARNRIIFHRKFSTTFQFIGIILFWAWVFNVYYAKEFMFYSPSWKISFYERYKLVLAYTKGTIAGLKFTLT